MTTATPTANGNGTTVSDRLRAILFRQETVLFFILVAGVLLMSMLSDVFLTPDNLLNQGRLATEIARRLRRAGHEIV